MDISTIRGLDKKQNPQQPTDTWSGEATRNSGFAGTKLNTLISIVKNLIFL